MFEHHKTATREKRLKLISTHSAIEKNVPDAKLKKGRPGA